ncbi:MAG: hypothetical protein J5809_08190 [Selenomonadaceae bacterium]|nr:hypothetical protein [Selenomonadaceae bacterium]
MLWVNFYGGVKVEICQARKTQKNFAGDAGNDDCFSWIFHGGGGRVAFAAENVQPSATSGNSVEVNSDNYSINGTTTAADGEYDAVFGGGYEQNPSAANNNRVTINGGRINGVFGGMSTYGGATGNRIVINGGNISGGVIGGAVYFPYDSTSSVGNVTDNLVIINGGTVNFVSGGEIAYAYPTDGSAPDLTQEFFQSGGDVSGNTAQVEGGTVTNGVSGGSALTGSATGNTVNINGGKISGSVIGSEVRYPTENSAVTGNTINISGSPDLSGANLIGGLLGSGYSPDGNTLNINTSGITAKNIYGFGGVNFHVPDSLLNNTTPMLTLTDGSTSLGLDSVGVYFDGNSSFKTGDTVNLIYNANGLNTGDTTSQDLTVQKGSTSIYGLNLANNGTGLSATIGNRLGDTDNVSSVPYPVLAPIEIVPALTYVHIPIGFDQYVDEDGYFMTPEEGKAQAVENVRENRGFELFLNTGFGHIKTKTGDGTYVKADNTTIDLGFGCTLFSDNSQTYIAPVIEYNRGDYDSHLHNGITGSGKTKYFAGGVVARNMLNNGFYYEGSFRGGRDENNFTADNFIVNNSPQRVSYNMDAPLYAGHVRLGKFNRLNANNILEVYGIYAYTQQNGMNSDLSTGEHVSFNSVHSNRMRLGYRMTTRVSKISTIYTGLAFQYESNSGSTASGDVWSNSTAGAKGSSGMIELGWQIKPRKDTPWVVDAYATGWIGHQQGGTIMAKVKKSF